MATVLRDGSLDDLPALRSIFRRSSLSNDDDRVALLAHPEVLQLSVDRVRSGSPIVAVVDGEVGGFAMTLDVDGAVELDGLFVDPDHMRQGIGRDLVEAVAARASKRDITRIEVTANDHALAFYVRLGFVHDGIAQTQFAPAPRMFLELRSAAGSS